MQPEGGTIKARRLSTEETRLLRVRAQDFIEGLDLVTVPYGTKGRDLRREFDAALDHLHYAGSCQRVGRCMRLLVMNSDGWWVGGIVLGSPFPNVHERDVALGLKTHVKKAIAQGLHPWSRANVAYWTELQTVVNHARTFVFPDFQGQGVGIRSHQILLSLGIKRWKRRYPGPVKALDTLCDASDSGLFRRNGWDHVGRTKGFESDPQSDFATVEGDTPEPRNNVGLRKSGIQWEIWVKEL